MNLRPGYQKALEEIGAKVHHRDNVKPVLDKDSNPTGRTTSIIVAEVTTPTGSVLASAEHPSAEIAIHQAIEKAAERRNVVISGGDAKNVDPKEVNALKNTVAEMQNQIKVLTEALNAGGNGKGDDDNEGGDGLDFAGLGVSKLREYAAAAKIEGDVAKMNKKDLVAALQASGWKPEQ